VEAAGRLRPLAALATRAPATWWSRTSRSRKERKKVRAAMMSTFGASRRSIAMLGAISYVGEVMVDERREDEREMF